MNAVNHVKSDVPQGGWAGLRYWREDMLAGLQVALLWTPFSLGVALASGAPAVAGLISAIVAGLLYPFLGGSHVTVSGPAAALAPVLLWGMLALGQGDLAAGYPLVLVAIVFTGALQLVLAALKAGRYASLLPVTVVEAMLAAIGIMIIVRQLPSLVGAPAAPAPSVVQALLALPGQLGQAQIVPAVIGAVALALMFGWRRLPATLARWVPSAIVVAVLGALAGWLWQLPPTLRIAMPERLWDGIVHPDFAALWALPELWGTLAVVVLTFTMIDGVESVASVKAVDKIDPWRRQSDPNKTLQAMGVCNLMSGWLGGLTVIPNAVPSRANIDAGARTLWSNFYSGLFLLTFALLLPQLLSLIPLAAIAAILIYIGWRLCEPAIFRRMASIGRDRLLVFVATVVAILLTDLLKGMFIGLFVELALLVYLQMPPLRWLLTGRLTVTEYTRSAAQLLRDLFRSPVLKHRVAPAEESLPEGTHLLTLRTLVGFNTRHLEQVMHAIAPPTPVALRFTESAKLVDHAAMEFLEHWQEERQTAGAWTELQGLQQLQPFAPHPLASRLQEPAGAQRVRELDERARQMAALAQQLGWSFDPALQAVRNVHDFIYLRRGDQRESRNRLSGTVAGLPVDIIDYSHTSAPDYHVLHRHTLLVVHWPQPRASGARWVASPGHYLERYLALLAEVSCDAVPGHRCYSADGQLHPGFTAWVRELTAALGSVYVEYHRGATLMFAPHEGWETTERLHKWLQALPAAWQACQAAATSADDASASASAPPAANGPLPQT